MGIGGHDRDDVVIKGVPTKTDAAEDSKNITYTESGADRRCVDVVICNAEDVMSGKVQCSSNDASSGTLDVKLIGQAGITITEVNDGGAETCDVDVDINPETLVTAAATDEVLIADASDAFNIKKVTAQDIADLAAIYTHPNHSGEVTSTGDGAQVVDKTAISNQTLVTAAVGDHVLIGDLSDSDNLKKVTVQTIIDLVAGGGLATKAGSVAGASFSTVSGEKIFDVVFSSAFADANYAITIASTASRVWLYSTKVAGGFRIHAQSNSSLSGDTVDWQAIKHGES